MKSIHVVLIIVVVLVIAAGAVLLRGDSATTPSAQIQDDTIPASTPPAPTDAASDEAIDTRSDTTASADEMPETMVAGAYETYTPDKLARADDGSVVLFFHATWCPSCRALDADIEEQKEDIPEGVSILKVDYDTRTDLRKQYGVTTQHTLVEVDSDGNELQQWSGGSTLDTVLARL